MRDFKQMVIYQIYPKSFYDANNDGYGDLEGVIDKLDYLKWLGVDMIWLTPFYVSPQKDNGYDVADYYKIDPRFGTMADFERLVSEAKKRQIGLMLDMVFNHSSTEHPWFQKAIRGDLKYKDYYIFKEGPEGQLPSNWQSKFGGSAWAYAPSLKAYYLHLFDESQADLNWENEVLRQEIYDILGFWMAKGVEGFRLDVINLISKPPVFRDDAEGDGRRYYTDGPKIHQYLKALHQNTFGKMEGCITVGEMSSTGIEHCVRYSNPDEKELSMVFSFHHLKVDYEAGEKWTSMAYDFKALREILHTWQVEMCQGNGWNALFWCNHDQPRVLSRFGEEHLYPLESGKMLGTALHMMRGTPYIYQGEEIGMTNAHYTQLNQYRDVETLNHFQILREKGLSEEKTMQILGEKSRDNGRTPMQWNDQANAGFSEKEPWIEPTDNYKSINVEVAMREENSILYHYKKLIQLRKDYPVIAYGDYTPLMQDLDRVLAFKREYQGQRLVCINHFSQDSQLLELGDWYRGGAVLISNYPQIQIQKGQLILRPFESIVWYYTI